MPNARPRPGRSILRTALFLCAALLVTGAAGWWGWHWWSEGRFLESTDDAYLAVDDVTVMTKITGYVTGVPVADNQPVEAGDVLARIDESDYRVALDQAEADLAQAKANVATLDSQIAARMAARDQRQAEIEGADAALDFARKDMRRYEELAGSGAATRQRAEQAASQLRETEARLSGGHAALEAARQEIAVLHAERDSAEASLRHYQAIIEQARLNLAHAVVTAPIAGIVADKSVRVGQLVQPGSQLMTLVPIQDLYLVANFKETQIARIRPGAPVRIEVDGFPALKLAGTVDSLSPGSGAQFALLPPENATGNFVKIVQRVPVKIRLDADPAVRGRLRAGLSVTATIDTRNGE